MKPCPFCGCQDKDERLMDLWDRLDIGHVAFVHCTRCGTRGPSVYREGPRSADAAIAAARVEWDKRGITPGGCGPEAWKT